MKIIKDFVPHYLGLLLAVVLLRSLETGAYYFAAFSNTFTRFSLHGIINDLLTVSYFAIAAFAVFLLLSIISARIANRMLLVINSIYLVLACGLSLFYQQAGYLLDGSVFLYSFEEIAHVAASSDAGYLVPAITIISALLSYYLVIYKLPLRKAWLAVLVLVTMFGSIYMIEEKPRSVDFKRTSDYYMSCSKVRYFCEKTYESVKAGKLNHDFSNIKEVIRQFQEQHPKNDYVNPYYPFLCKDNKDDVLGDMLNLSDEPPNFVFIIVEGLSRVVSGPDPTLVGFTPFLDSLAEHSLYWTNFLATSERTFGVLPSMFGALPFGKEGFQAMKDTMPNHLTLIKLLNENNYHSSFFYAGWLGFTSYDEFLKEQQIDYLSDLWDGEKTADNISEGYYWGVSDRVLFNESIKQLGGRNSPTLDIYLTLSSHDPFVYEDKANYEKEFDAQVDALQLSPSQARALSGARHWIPSFMYLDDELKQLFAAYKKLPAYHNTIFVITGDHDIGYYSRSNLDLYRTPLLIYSPMLKQSKKMDAVAYHGNITPTITALLRNNYNVKLPKLVSWNTNVLDTSTNFQNSNSFPFMHNDRSILQYIDGEYFIDGDQLYSYTNGFELAPVEDEEKRLELKTKLETYKTVNNYACEHNKLLMIDESKLNRQSRILYQQRLDTVSMAALFNPRIKIHELEQHDSLYIIPGDIIYPLNIFRHELEENYKRLKLAIAIDIKPMLADTANGSLYLSLSIQKEGGAYLYNKSVLFDTNKAMEWNSYSFERSIRLQELNVAKGDVLRIMFVNNSGISFQLHHVDVEVLGVY